MNDKYPGEWEDQTRYAPHGLSMRLMCGAWEHISAGSFGDPLEPYACQWWVDKHMISQDYRGPTSGIVDTKEQAIEAVETLLAKEGIR